MGCVHAVNAPKIPKEQHIHSPLHERTPTGMPYFSELPPEIQRDIQSVEIAEIEKDPDSITVTLQDTIGSHSISLTHSESNSTNSSVIMHHNNESYGKISASVHFSELPNDSIVVSRDKHYTPKLSSLQDYLSN